MVQHIDSPFNFSYSPNKYHFFKPHALTVVKHLNNELVGYLEYSSSIYGQKSLHVHAMIHYHLDLNDWRFKSSSLNRDQAQAFLNFLSDVHHYLNRHLQVDLSLFQSQFNEFEKVVISIPSTWYEAMNHPVRSLHSAHSAHSAHSVHTDELTANNSGALSKSVGLNASNHSSAISSQLLQTPVSSKYM